MSKIYLRISDDRLYAKNLNTGSVFDDVPVVAFPKNDFSGFKVMAVGQEAASMPVSDDVEKSEPFDSHPRVLIGQLDAAGRLLNHVVNLVAGQSFLKLIKPTVIVDVARKLEGGTSEAERKILLLLLEDQSAGRVVFLPDGTSAELSAEELEKSLLESGV